MSRWNWSDKRRRYLKVVGIVVLALVAIYLGTLIAGLQSQGFQPIWQQVSIPPCVVDPANLPPASRPDGSAANYLHTCGARIYNSKGHEVRITGINWFGMETGTYVPHGLWWRNWRAMLDQISRLGYNTIRLPYSNEMLSPGVMPQGINYIINPDLEGLTSLEVMDKFVAAARERGIKIILDRHRPTSAGQSPLWYTAEVPEEQWISDWQMLARRYYGDDTVIGVDLHNEPRGEATWGSGDRSTDWALAAERAGNAVLEANPYLLILVEGVESYDGDWYWWGGNLRGVASRQIILNIPNRVVYSPHDYGPDVFQQGWFSDPDFPGNLPGVWDWHWGFIQKEGIAPVVVGEFGGPVTEGAEGTWQRALLEYMRKRQVGFVNWTINPNSSDTGGLLADDWQSVVQEKQDLYRQYLAPPIDVPDGTQKAAPKSKFKILYHSADLTDQVNNISFFFQIYNDGPTPVDLSRMEVRYWFNAANLRGRTQIAEVDWSTIDKGQIHTEFVPVGSGTGDYFLRITFGQGSGSIEPYTPSGPVLMRFHKSDWSNYAQSNDYSFGSLTETREWDRITLYLDGNLVWGQEP